MFNQDRYNGFTKVFFNTCKHHHFQLTSNQKERCLIGLAVLSHLHQHGNDFLRIRNAEELALDLQRKVGGVS